MRKHEVGTEEKIEDEYPMGYSMEWYIHKHKEFESKRSSFNERKKYWESYRNRNKGLDPETSFDMGKF